MSKTEYYVTGTSEFIDNEGHRGLGIYLYTNKRKAIKAAREEAWDSQITDYHVSHVCVRTGDYLKPIVSYRLYQHPARVYKTDDYLDYVFNINDYAY